MPLVQHRVKRLLFAGVRQNRLIQPQQLAERPSLKWTASWGVRRIGIGYLRNASESRFIEVFIEWRQESVARFLLHKGRVAAHTKPGFDTGAHKPRPDSSLMIAAVALDSIARFIWPKTTQPFGSQQRSFDDIHDGESRFLFEETEGQADGENLVWTQARVQGAALMIAVNHIKETKSHIIPESGSKGSQA
jgi:hypothetical protein